MLMLTRVPEVKLNSLCCVAAKKKIINISPTTITEFNVYKVLEIFP